jgi:hypothetical protein
MKTGKEVSKKRKEKKIKEKAKVKQNNEKV